jgi:putative membrane protein
MPRAFAPATVTKAQTSIDAIVASEAEEDILATPPPKLLGFLGKLFWGTAAALISLALGLALDSLIRDLFAATPWLGWMGLAVLALFLVALVALSAREILSLSRLRALDALKRRAEAALISDRRADGQAVLGELTAIYETRPDLARGRDEIARSGSDIFDGGDIIRLPNAR